MALLRAAAFSFNNAEATGATSKVLEDLEGSDGLEACVAAVNHRGECGVTPLMIAAHKGFVNCIKILLAWKADPNAQSASGCSSLLLAAEEGHLAVVTELGTVCDLNLSSSSQTAPLHGAARYGHVEVVRYLLVNGADARRCLADGCTVLFLAAASGYELIVQDLLAHERDDETGDVTELTKHVNAQNNEGTTALIEAAMYGHEASVELLLAARADVEIVNKLGETALLTACANGNEKTARMLFQADGGSIDATGPRGETTLMAACRYGHLTMVRTLIALGVEPNTVDASGETALMHVCQYEQDDDDEMLELLLKAGASVDFVRLNDGSTALHIACETSHDEAVAQVLKAGADVNAVRADGHTPLTLASSNGYESTLSLLLAAKEIQINKPLKVKGETDGMTALHCAAFHGQLVAVNRLLYAGANSEAKTRKKQTAFTLAVNGDTPEHKQIAARLKEARGGGGTGRRGSLSVGRRGRGKRLPVRGEKPPSDDKSADDDDADEGPPYVRMPK